MISTHDLNLASGLCRTLVLMRDGRVIATGPTSEVLTVDNIRRLYGVEAEIVQDSTGHRIVVPQGRTATGSVG